MRANPGRYYPSGTYSPGAPWNAQDACETCNGSGVYSASGRGSDSYERCPDCHGEGVPQEPEDDPDRKRDEAMDDQITGRRYE